MERVTARDELFVLTIPALVNRQIAESFKKRSMNPFKLTASAVPALPHCPVIPQLQYTYNSRENRNSFPRKLMLDRITVHGARQHNLKNIDVEIPRNSLTVITGLSGSGKSSLAFDTIYAEGQRRYV